MSAPLPTAQQEHWIEQCQGLVRSLAVRIHRKLPACIELDDLIAYGELGLLEAAQSFDPRRGCQFSTFAYYRIRGAIYDGAAKMGWGVSVAQPPLDAAGSESRCLEDASQTAPPTTAMESELNERLHEMVDTLPQAAADLIRATFFEGLTLEEAGRRQGLSKSWASRVRTRALQSLARSLACWKAG